MALLPALSSFEIGAANDSQLFHTGVYPGEWLPLIGRETWDEGVERFAPHWFVDGVIFECWKSRALEWDRSSEMDDACSRVSREDWEIEWPALLPQSRAYHSILTNGVDEQEKMCATPYLDPMATGRVRGVNICPCGCGNIIWTSATFVHKFSGRRVVVEVTFHGKPEIYLPLDAESACRKRCGGNMYVVLRPGATPLPVTEGDAGLGYDANEEYWGERRRNNGDWRAWMRYAWRQIPSPSVLLGGKVDEVGSEDRLPGSMALGQGDWARIDEMRENQREVGRGGRKRE